MSEQHVCTKCGYVMVTQPLPRADDTPWALPQREPRKTAWAYESGTKSGPPSNEHRAVLALEKIAELMQVLIYTLSNR